MAQKKVRPTLSTYNDAGQEILDPEPLSVDVKFKRPLSVAEEVAKLMRDPSFRSYLSDHGAELFEEADDFDIPDDPIDPTTPYEDNFEPEQPGLVARVEEIKHGIVQDIPIEQKLKDRRIIDERKRSKKRDDRSHQVDRNSDRRDDGLEDADATGDSLADEEHGPKDTVNGPKDTVKGKRSNARART